MSLPSFVVPLTVANLCRQIEQANERIRTLTSERNALQDKLDRVRNELNDNRWRWTGQTP